MRVLVTGGSGFLGKRLQLIKPDWIYLSSKDCDLTNQAETISMIGGQEPDAIIHLAAKVGGIKDNNEKQAEYNYLNTIINTNLVYCAHKLGINRILAALSTCAFPDVVV